MHKKAVGEKTWADLNRRQIEKFILDRHAEGMSPTKISQILPEQGFRALSRARVSQIISEHAK